jgi:hypothetical protein
MSHLLIRFSLVAALLLAPFVQLPSVRGSEFTSEFTSEVTASADVLDAWLGEGDTGKGWAEYLLSPSLREQVTQGDAADRKVLENILEKYSGDATGLDDHRFVRVREALAAWIAELSLPALDELPKAAINAKSQFDAPGKDALGKADKQLRAAIDRLDDYLSDGGENGVGWKKYLRFEDLQEELAKQGGPTADALAPFVKKLSAKHAGLDLDQFTDVRTGLEQYVAATKLPDAGELKVQYEAVLDGLSTELKTHGEKPSDATRKSIGLALGWLEKNRQAADLVAAVRKYHSRLNLLVEVDLELIAAGVRDKIEEEIEIDQVILGTDITGSGVITGTIDLKLVPSGNKAILLIVLKGVSETQNVGRNGPVTIYTESYTEFTATKKLIISETGIEMLPAVAHAVIDSDVTGIDGGAIATRIAERRIAESQGQAEYIAARKAEVLIAERMDAQVAELLGDTNEKFQTKFRDPLVEAGGFPRLLKFSTTSDVLRVVAQQAASTQLAAPTAPPKIPGKHALKVRLHETMLNNLLATTLAGKKVDDAMVRKEVTELLGALPAKFADNPDEDPWSITFAKENPITITFSDGGLSVTVRGRRFTSGDSKYGAMNITATYKLEKTDSGMKATRQGDLKILPPGYVKGKTKLSFKQTALRKVLNRRFGKLLESEFASGGIALPGRWESAGMLVLANLSSKDGWLALAWDQQPIKTAALPSSGVPPLPDFLRVTPKTAAKDDAKAKPPEKTAAKKKPAVKK